VEIRSLSPAHLFIKEGAVLAKLAKLPKGKSFQLSTPVNVAVVQGSAYEAVYRDDAADVYNFSSSPVQVFSFDEKGKRRPTPLVLKEFQKTRAPFGDPKTLVAEKITAKEKTRGQKRIRAVEGKVKRRHARQAKAQVSPATTAKAVKKKPAVKSKASPAVKKKTTAKKSPVKRQVTKKPVTKKTQSSSKKTKAVSKKTVAKKAKTLPVPKPKSTKKPVPKTGG